MRSNRFAVCENARKYLTERVFADGRNDLISDYIGGRISENDFVT